MHLDKVVQRRRLGVARAILGAGGTGRGSAPSRGVAGSKQTATATRRPSTAEGENDDAAGHQSEREQFGNPAQLFLPSDIPQEIGPLGVVEAFPSDTGGLDVEYDGRHLPIIDSR